MIALVDMDAFFTSVEEMDNPELCGKCVVVGNDSPLGVAASANYEARKFGIHSAMPIFKVKKLCPSVIIAHPRKQRYQEISSQIMDVLNGFSPLVEQASIDEAYIDISGTEKLFGTWTQTSQKIKKEIQQKVKLTCSIGIAPNKFLAKIASNIKKPDGLTIIKPEEALSFARELKIEKIPGVGEETKKYFDNIGVKVLGDILKIPIYALSAKLGKTAFRFIDLANCIDKTKIIPNAESKSFSLEATLDDNTFDKDMLVKYLLQQSENIGRRLRRYGVSGKTITIKLKHSDFTQITRSVTLPSFTSSSNTIYKEAKKLLSEYKIVKSVRLIGVKVSSIIIGKMPFQKSLFETAETKEKKWEKIEKTLDSVYNKFGKNIIKRASLDFEEE